MKKRGQANIIVTVLLILIVLAAIIILANIILPLIRKGAEQTSGITDIVSTQLEIEETKVWVTGGAKIKIHRGAGEGEIKALKFIFIDDEDNSHIIERTVELPGKLETKSFTFTPQEVNFKVEKISVVPVFSNGKTGLEIKKDNLGDLNNEENSGLISWWKFDGNSQDSIGVNHGTTEGNAIIENNVLKIPNQDGYFDIPDNDFKFTTEDFTISVWINTLKTGSEPPTNFEIFNGGDHYLQFGYLLRLEGSRDGLHFRTRKSSSQSYTTCNSDNIIPRNQWTYIAIVKSGSNAKYYIKATNIENEKECNGVIDNPDLTSRDIGIGGSSFSSQRFKGSIDNVMVFNKALSQDEVTAIYNNQKK